jgi:hypothetical protein
MPRMNIYAGGAYQGGGEVSLDPRYARALVPSDQHVRPQTGSIRMLSNAQGAIPSGFITPGVYVDFVLNNVATGVPVSVLADDGEQLLLTQVTADQTNLHPNAEKFLLLRFLLGNVPVTDWLTPIPTRQLSPTTTAPAPATVEYGYYPGLLPAVFTLKFDQLQFALSGGNANLNVQGLVATGDARFSGVSIPNL